MSLDNLTYAEEWYFTHDRDYHKDIMFQLKELGLPLRLPSNGEAHSGIDAFVMSRGIATGHVPARVKRRWRKRDRIYKRELEEIYA